jgi:hypothetical protein
VKYIYIFIGKKKVILFLKFKENCWVFVASVLKKLFWFPTHWVEL